jgi:hypothetical protein
MTIIDDRYSYKKLYICIDFLLWIPKYTYIINCYTQRVLIIYEVNSCYYIDVKF